MLQNYRIADYSPSLSSLFAVCSKSQFGPHDYLYFVGVTSIHVDILFPVKFIRFKKIDEIYKRYFFSNNDEYIDAVGVSGGLAIIQPYVLGNRFLNQISNHPITQMSEQDFLDAEKNRWQFKDEDELNHYVAKIDRSRFFL